MFAPFLVNLVQLHQFHQKRSKHYESQDQYPFYDRPSYPPRVRLMAEIVLAVSIGRRMMGMRLCGLSPKEHFRLYGTLPTDVQEKLIEEHGKLVRLLQAANEIATDLEEQAYRNHECFETQPVAEFLKCVRGLHGLL